MKLCWFLLIVVFLHFKLIQLSSTTNKRSNYAALRGSTVTMKCIPPDVSIDKSKVYSERSFVWTNEEGQEIVNPRLDTLKTGELKIIKTREEDSGVYHCKFRPPEAFKHNGAVSRIFVHKLIVYEISGHKFETLVLFDVTKQGSEDTVTLLRDLLKEKICASQLCSPGPVTSDKCEVTEMEKQMCEMAMTYEALEPLSPPKNCNETCVQEIMIDRLKKAQKLLETALMSLSEDSQARLQPEMQTFDTKSIVTCKAGYHLIEANYAHCFPCLPGTYSEAESLKCDMCPIGFYQEKYGSHECELCLDDMTTEMVGSKSRDECRLITDTGILKDIKVAIASLFKG